jgi:hypothetical protein
MIRLLLVPLHQSFDSFREYVCILQWGVVRSSASERPKSRAVAVDRSWTFWRSVVLATSTTIGTTSNMKKATKGNEKKPMIRNVVPSTYKMGNDNVCLSLSLFFVQQRPTKSQASPSSSVPAHLFSSPNPLFFKFSHSTPPPNIRLGICIQRI